MLPEDERPAVARALAKDPAVRWTSCREFVQSLSGQRLSSEVSPPAPARETQLIEELIPTAVQSSAPTTPALPTPLSAPRPRSRRVAYMLLALIPLAGLAA